MNKYKKNIIISLAVVAFFITICFIPINAYKLIPLLEEQVAKDLGVKIHIERLILRVGPSVKLKAPIMHIMYDDGQKFAQFDAVKFYIPWYSILKKTPNISLIDAKKLLVKIKSDDQYLPLLLEKLQNKKYSYRPGLKLKEYSISYYNVDFKSEYTFKGQHFDLGKNIAFKNYKLKTAGSLNVDSKRYITYDLTVVPNIENLDFNKNFDIISFLEQVKEFDFCADIITDIKLYQNQDKLIQASGFINIDNISVLDITKKDPKSFIYLTLWGDKASVLSNIYASGNKKIYIDGMINNSKKPIID